jgi:uncharacterized protein (TIGR03437 family)
MRAPACSLKISSGSVGSGGLLIIPVVIESQGRATGIQFDVAFDHSALSISTISGDSAATIRQNPQYAEIDADTRRVLVVAPAGLPLPDGTLMSLFIRPAASAKPGSYPLSIRSAVCTGATAASLDVTSESGSVTIIGDNSPPVLTSAGVLNGASLLPGAVSPGEIISLAGYFPDGGTPRLTIGQADAMILYRDAKQINAVLPDSLPSSGHAALRLLIDNTEVSSFDVALGLAAPWVFTRNMGGTGYANALNEDGSVNMPAAPAARSSTVTIWLTGIPRSLVSSSAIAVSIEGQLAKVVEATPESDNPAVTRVRFVIPGQAPTGPTSTLSVSVGDALSQSGVWLSIR